MWRLGAAGFDQKRVGTSCPRGHQTGGTRKAMVSTRFGRETIGNLETETVVVKPCGLLSPYTRATFASCLVRHRLSGCTSVSSFETLCCKTIMALPSFQRSGGPLSQLIVEAIRFEIFNGFHVARDDLHLNKWHQQAQLAQKGESGRHSNLIYVAICDNPLFLNVLTTKWIVQYYFF